MRRMFEFLVLFSFLCVLIPGLWSAPKLVVEPRNYDWGRQKENKGAYDFSFELRNEGDAPLILEKVHPGCGCTKVKVPKYELAPGEKIIMTGVLKTNRYEGRMAKSITITSNDPKHKNTYLQLRILLPFSAEGMRLKAKLYGCRLRKDGLYAYVTVENCEADKEYHIQGAELPEGWSIVKPLPLAIKPEGRAIVMMRFPLPKNGEAPEAFDNLPFTLLTDCPKTPEIKAGLLYRPRKKKEGNKKAAGSAKKAVGASEKEPLSAPEAKNAERAEEKLPKLKLDPEVYDWGRQEKNEGTYNFSFHITNEGTAPLKLLKVRPGCGCTKIEVPKKELAPGETMTMTGVLKTKNYEGRVSKGIIITSNDPRRKIKIARLLIRFPFNAEGMRIKAKRYASRFRSGSLYAYITVENCEPDKNYHIQGAELPEGWSIRRTFPIEIKAEERATLVLRCPVAEGKKPEPFENLSFTLLTDCPKTPKLSAALMYRSRKARPKRKFVPVSSHKDPKGEKKPHTEPRSHGGRGKQKN